MRKLIMNKKGQVGLDLAKRLMIGFLILAVMAIAVFLALTTLQDSNIFTANSQGANQTALVVGNVTSATADFFGNTGTFFSILVAVIVIIMIGIVLAVVTRFGGSKSGL